MCRHVRPVLCLDVLSWPIRRPCESRGLGRPRDRASPAPSTHRDIGHPFGIRCRCSKIVPQDILRHRMGMLAVGGVRAMAATLGTESKAPHEPRYSLYPASLAVGAQRRVNTRTAIDLAVGLIDPLDMLSQHRIFSAPPAGSAFVPGVVSTHGDLQDSTHRGDGALLLTLCYESVLHQGVTLFCKACASDVQQVLALVI